MKRILVLLIVYGCSQIVCGQCIDALVVNEKDTIFGRLVGQEEDIYTFDSYNTVFTIKKEMVMEYIPCIRQATRQDILQMKHIETLSTEDMTIRKNTQGYFLHKSARNFYWGISLFAGGLTANTLSLTAFNDSKAKWPVFAVGTVAAAGGLFFLLRSFYFVDKAGKLMDLERSSIHLEPTEDGNLGIKWKF